MAAGAELTLYLSDSAIFLKAFLASLSQTHQLVWSTTDAIDGNQPPISLEFVYWVL